MSVLSSIYKKSLTRFPYPTRIVVSGSILCFVDFMSQTFIEQKDHYDFKRMAANFTIGSAAGPWLFVWFSKLQPRLMTTVLPPHLANTPIFNFETRKICYKRLFLKIGSDYFICFPVMQIIYHVLFNILYNNSLQAILHAFDTKFTFSLSNHYQAWPIVSCFIHLLFPIPLKAILTNLSGATWNNYVNHVFRTGGHIKEKDRVADSQ